MANKKKPTKPSSRREGPASEQSGKPTLPSRLLSEQMLRDIHRVLGNHEFKNAKEMNGYLRKLVGPGLEKALKDAPPLTPKEEAQELAYRAMEAEDENQAGFLARQALEKDPDCVDALVTVAEVFAQSPEDLITGLAQAVEAGERSLGASFFTENKGHFWGIIETRPYMRARHLLAEALYADGQVSKPIQHYEALLDLNPNDNQGIRDILLGCYLAQDELAGARRLFEEYKEDASAVFGWGRTLERILSADFAGAAKALRQARRDNPYVELYLTAKKKLPPESTDSYSFGSDEEAHFCMEMLGEAWTLHPEALLWLRTRLLPAGPPNLFYKKGAGS